MTVKQISVFIENRPGRLFDITDTLARGEVSIRAFTVADTIDFGILRLIVDKPQEAINVLRDAKFTVSETEVIAVKLGDKVGALSRVLQVLRDAGVSVEYAYAFVSHSADSAMVILRVNENETAIRELESTGIEVMGEDRLRQL